MEDWFRAEAELLKRVPIELGETDEAFTIRAEVPGFTPKELDVRAEANSICIHGRKEESKEEKKGKEIRYSEVAASELCRRIDLPKSINSDGVSAQLSNGVLEVTVPKATPPKSIEVKAA